MSSAELGDIGSRPMEVRRGGGIGHFLVTIVAFFFLGLADLVLRGLSFRSLHRLVGAWPSLGRRTNAESARKISDATDRAATLYFKHPWCLQRSAAAVLLLRCLGFPAELVIGVRRVPFYTHAWVELESEPINESPDVIANFRVMVRC